MTAMEDNGKSVKPTLRERADTLKKGLRVLGGIRREDIMRRDEVSDVPLLLVCIVGFVVVFGILMYELIRLFG